MPRERQSLDQLEPLPNCKGPKLSPFADRHSSINFVRLLESSRLSNSESSEESSYGGAHGYVFEVLIGSKRYALKIFRFYDDEEDRYLLMDWEKDRVSLDTIRAHQDPFYNECRAYGRLIQKKVNGKIAAHCYGYINLPAEREIELRQRFDIVSWDRPSEDVVKPVAEQRPLRAIVKELLLEDYPLNEKVLNKMLRDLLRMRRLGVYPRDIAARNFKNGLLVDFSCAMTKPHYLFDVRSKFQVESLQGQDLRGLQQMMYQSKVTGARRAVPSREYCSKLRSYTKMMEHADRQMKHHTKNLAARKPNPHARK